MSNQAEQLFEEWKRENASNESVSERQIEIENDLYELGYVVGSCAGEWVLVEKAEGE